MGRWVEDVGESGGLVCDQDPMAISCVLSDNNSSSGSLASTAATNQVSFYPSIPQKHKTNSDLHPSVKGCSKAAFLGGILGAFVACLLTTAGVSEERLAFGRFIPRHSMPHWRTNSSNATLHQRHRSRHLATSTAKSPNIVIAGKMTVGGGSCNIAQYNLATKNWSLTERIQLSLYNSYSGGEVYSLLANYTIDADGRQSGSGELIVVGAFDTTYRNSQVTYCSVGKWDGIQLSKVGEGLCNSALSKGMKITTASLAGRDNVYVAGSFQTQVWSGGQHEFVQIYNIAHFDASAQVWSPLDFGQISCSWCTVTVLAMAWDQQRRQLHVAGKFNSIDGRNVPAGLAVYNFDTGHLVAHPGGGLSMHNVSQDGVGTALQLDPERRVLYVMGSFQRLTQKNQKCGGLAAYEIETNRWTCLADDEHSVTPTGGGNMLLTPFGLMVAGKTTSSSTWPYRDRPYTIALLKDTMETKKVETDDEKVVVHQYHDFHWSWLAGFKGHNEPLHALSNGFGSFEGSVFIAGDNLVARWSLQPRIDDEDHEGDSSLTDDVPEDDDFESRRLSSPAASSTDRRVPHTELLGPQGLVRGAIMAM